MPDVQEVFRMTTQKVRPDPEALERQHREQRWHVAKKRIGAYALVAALVVAGVLIGINTLRSDAPRPGAGPAERGQTLSGPFFLELRRDCPNCRIETGQRTPLAERLAGGYNYVASPDGTRLAYGTNRGGGCAESHVTIANIDGTDAHTLQSPEGLIICGARWSPDGTKLVYQERDGGDDVGNLFVHDLSSGRRTQITDLELSRAWWWFLSPSFSPDGRNVIFHMPRDSSETTTWDVWSVPVTGGEHTLVLRNGSFPMLGADLANDVRIAYVSPWPNDFAGHSVMTARLLSPPDLSDLHGTLVEANDSIWWPTMSPDGGSIAYQDGGSIYVIDFSRGAGLAPVSSKVADGNTAEWLDNDTLIVAP
jgi:hypothetical protein